MRQPTTKPRKNGVLTLTIGLSCLLLSVISIGAVAASEVEEDRDQERVYEVIKIRDHDGMPIAVSLGGHRTYLGVSLTELSAELREHFGGPEDAGVMVSKVMEDSPATRAGLQVGDIIAAIDGERIEHSHQLARQIMRRDPEDMVNLEIWRDGQFFELSAELEEGERPLVDVRRFVHRSGDGDGEGFHHLTPEQFHQVFELDPETLNDAMEKLNEELGSPHWQQKVHRFWESREELQERLKGLEERLEELERELSELEDQ